MANNQLLWMAWTQAWQISLLIVVVLAATRCFASNRPHLAHVLWLVVLVKCLTPPLLASPSGVFCWLQDHFAKSDAPAEIRPQQFSATASRVRSTEPPNVVVWTENSARFSEPSAFRSTNRVQTWVWPHIRLWSIVSGVWAVGAIFSIAISAWRWTRCWRMIRRAEVEGRDDLVRTVAALADRLGIRKHIDLVVTSSRIGPAVIGIWKPLILLPAAVVQGKTAKELEPILAHELVHVRRGDLWVGLAQVLSQSLWWFHPLVWLANRFLTRDAERCCDEEVIAELGCSPAQYARSLLDVLELKRTLQPVPAFPGVRPVDITSRRLERIMKLGQGSHKRTPWWCGLVMVLVAGVVLPGAPWTLAKDKQKQDGSNDAKKAQTLEWPAKPAAASTANSVTKVYRLKDVVDRLQRDFGLSEAEAKAKLEQMLPVTTGLNGSKQPYAWSGRKLIVQTSARSHGKIAEAIQCIQNNGTQFQIEMHVFTGPAEAMAKLKLDWKTPSEATPEAKALDFRLGSDLLVQQASATQSVETPSLMLLAEIDDPGARSVLQQINETSDLSAISHPKILTILGQQASLQIGDQRPFVVGFDKADDGKFTPRVRTFFSGLAIQVLPQPYKHDQIQLDYQLQQSEITKVNNLRSREGPNPEWDKVQLPTIRTSKITTAHAVKLDRTLLIRGLAPSEESGKPVETLVMLRCSQPNAESNTNFEIKPNPDPQPQPSGPYSAPTSAKGGKSRESIIETPHYRERADHVNRLESGVIQQRGNVELWAHVGKPEQLILRADQIELNPDTHTFRANGHVMKLDGNQTGEPKQLPQENEAAGSGTKSKKLGITRPNRSSSASHHENARNVFTRTYYVADLIIPANAVQTKPANANERADSKKSQNESVFDELKILSALIKSAVEPTTWADRGGPGAIEEFPTNVSLVISQTEEAHQKVADLLSQLRRRFELQVSFENHLIGLPDDFLSTWEIQRSASRTRANRGVPESIALPPIQKVTYLQKDNKEKLLQAAEKHNVPRSMHLPKVTVFHGQSADLHFGPEDRGMNLQVRPDFSSETNKAEKRVCFFEYTLRSCGTDVSNEQLIKSAMVVDGDSLLINVHEFLTRKSWNDMKARQSRASRICRFLVRFSVAVLWHSP